MLRECPIDHRCMKGITPDRVLAALSAAGVELIVEGAPSTGSGRGVRLIE